MIAVSSKIRWYYFTSYLYVTSRQSFFSLDSFQSFEIPGKMVIRKDDKKERIGSYGGRRKEGDLYSLRSTYPTYCRQAERALIERIWQGVVVCDVFSLNR
jgi:hypothetical protein